MKECAVDRERAVVAHHQVPEVPELADGAFDDPAPPVPPQLAPGLRGWTNAIFLCAQINSMPCRCKRFRNGSLSEAEVLQE